ncbi:MAG: multisubunit Na+/H+ antiporter MnhE subunit [Acidimicrobiales bacterium]
MTQFFTIRRVITMLGLTATWCVLWRDVSLTNLIVGVFFSVAVVASGIGTNGQGPVRPVPLVRFALLVAIDLVKSTASVAHEILTPTDYTEEAVVAVPLRPEDCNHLLLLAIAVTLTPGTAVIDADPHTGTLYLHLLHHDRRDATVAHVHELARLASLGLSRGDA